MKKFLGFLVLLIFAVSAFFFIAKDWLVKKAFASAVQTLTGFETRIQGLRLDPFNGVIHLRGLILYNPLADGFKQKVFGDAPEIYLDIDLPALLKSEKVHFRELRLNISQLNVEKNARGVSNVSLLNPVRNTRPQKSPTPGKKMPFQLDRFELTLRRISYDDHSGIIPKKLAVDMHVNKQVFEGITDAKSIVQIIVMKVVSASPLANLGVNAAEIQRQLKDKVQTARELGAVIYKEAKVEVLATKTTEVGKKFLGEGTQTLGQVGGAAKTEIAGLWGKVKSKVSEAADAKR